MRWILRLGGAAAIAAISIVGTLAWVTLHRLDKPPVPLTAGLSGTWEAVSNEFDRRVRAAFPTGSSEKDMASALQRQGFWREDWDSSIEHEHAAIRREDSFLCNQAARIYWRADGDGKLTAIRGVYREEGCL
jgi:hypothetical protein